MIDITLPQLEAGATEALVEHYFVQPGDVIEAGQPLAIARTERFVWDVPATRSGMISEIVVEPGARAPIGAALVRVASATTADAPDTATRAAQKDRAARATPVARNIAAAHNLDLATMRGSGCGGLITRQDVLALLDIADRAAPTTPIPIAQSAPSGSVTTTAANETLPALPPSIVFTPPTLLPSALTAIAIDCTAINRSIARMQERLARRGVAVSLAACVADAVLRLLPEHRLVNSAWSEDGIIVRGGVRLGIVHQQPDAHLHVLVRAEELNVHGLARRLHEYCNNGQQGNDRSAQAQPTLVIVEGGCSYWSEATLLHDHAATLYIGAAMQRPIVAQQHGKDTIVLRPMAMLTLAYDARILDQSTADAFLAVLKERLERFNAL